MFCLCLKKKFLFVLYSRLPSVCIYTVGVCPSSPIFPFLLHDKLGLLVLCWHSHNGFRLKSALMTWSTCCLKCAACAVGCATCHACVLWTGTASRWWPHRPWPCCAASCPTQPLAQSPLPPPQSQYWSPHWHSSCTQNSSNVLGLMCCNIKLVLFPPHFSVILEFIFFFVHLLLQVVRIPLVPFSKALCLKVILLLIV